MLDVRKNSPNPSLCALVPLWLLKFSSAKPIPQLKTKDLELKTAPCPSVPSVSSACRVEAQRRRVAKNKTLSATPIPKLKTQNLKLKTALLGFTLVEVLIVVAILGILAAIVIPLYENNSQKAKESAAKENLRVLRNAIELYAAQHKGVPPGYLNNAPTSTPASIIFLSQMTKNKPYLSGLPKNPFSGQNSVYVFANNQTLDESTAATTVSTAIFGWVYKPATKTIKLHWPGTDSKGEKYFDY